MRHKALTITALATVVIIFSNQCLAKDKDQPRCAPSLQEMNVDAIIGKRIEQLMREYSAIYSSMDASKIKSIYPSFAHTDALIKQFDGMKKFKREIAIEKITLSDDQKTATVYATETDEFTAKVGKANQRQHRYSVFSVSAQDTNWIMLDRPEDKPPKGWKPARTCINENPAETKYDEDRTLQ